MRAFSQLLDDLVYTRSRNTKLRLIGDYLKETPDPDRGYGLAALTGTLDIPHVKPAAIRSLVEEGTLQLSLFDDRDLAEITPRSIQVSGWWCAAIHCWPMNVPVSAASYWTRPRRNCSMFRLGSDAIRSRFGVRMPSHLRSVP